jgi:hypothetical protein
VPFISSNAHLARDRKSERTGVPFPAPSPRRRASDGGKIARDRVGRADDHRQLVFILIQSASYCVRFVGKARKINFKLQNGMTQSRRLEQVLIREMWQNYSLQTVKDPKIK